MKKSVLLGIVAAMAILAFSFAGVDAALFTEILDGDNNSQFFDVGTTTESGNVLTIGVNNFTADGDIAPYNALDTLAFKYTAPAGQWITKISYIETVTGATSGGVAIAQGSITAAGIPMNFAMFVLQGNSNTNAKGIETTVDIPGKPTEIYVSIVNSLFAYGDGSYITKEAASVTVSTVPIPSTLLLLGGGLLGVFGLKRKRS